MKRAISLSALVLQLAAAKTCLAQFPQVSLFSTGTNSAGNGVQTYNSADLHWMASITGSTGPFVQARVCDWAYSGWQQTPWANAQWISYPHTCQSTDIADHTCMNANLTTWYKLEVTLPACKNYTTQDAFCLTMDYYADNAVAEIRVNGVLNYTTSLSNPFVGYEFASQNSVTLCNGWTAGTNTLLIALASEAGTPTSWEALLATFTATANAQTTTMPLSISGSTTICRGSAVQLTASGAQNYTWQPTGIIGPYLSITPSLTTTYSLDASNGEGCTASKTVTVYVTECTSLQERVRETYFTVDAARGIIRLQSPCSAFVTDFSGRKVAYSTTENEVDISQLEEGIYILMSEGPKPFREKFMKVEAP